MKATTLYGGNRVLEFLGKPKNIKKLAAETRRKIDAGEMKLVDSRLYVRKDVSGFGGTNELFASDDSEKQGLRNFSRGLLPADKPFVITSIKIGVKETDETNPANVADYSSLRSAFDPALANGKLVISQNDKPVLQMEIVEGTVNAVSTSAVGKDDVKDLDQLALLVDSQRFKWEIVTAEGLTITPGAGNKIHLEVICFGQEIVFD